jgi:uncharacterized protein with gpF-like domain
MIIPKALDREYYSAINAIFIQPLVRLIETELIPRVAEFARAEGIRVDAWGQDLRILIDKLEIQYGRIVTEKEAEALAARMARRVESINSAQFKRQMKVLANVELVGGAGLITQKTLTTFVDANVSLIRSIPHELLDKVETTVSNAIRAGERAESFMDSLRDMVKEKVKNAEARAALIARDQIGKLNGQITQERQTDLGVEKYTWRTALDDRVRESAGVGQNRVLKICWNKFSCAQIYSVGSMNHALL